MDILKLSLTEAVNNVREGSLSAVDLVTAYLEKAKEVNPDINAYVEIFDDALEQAQAVDAKVKSGESLGELAGVPVAIKDNILIQGKIATGASKILDGYRATYDAFVIEQLKQADAVLVGRVNMDEFAMGGSTETSCYGVTKNPRDTTRVPGGSSGGSAASVAMNGALASLGTDTGGSIRQPAAFCGVVGLKPTYGAVSRRGAMAMASSLDQVGPLGKSVDDVERVYNVIKGYDIKDSTSLTQEEYEKEVPTKKKTYTIGVPEDFVYADGVDTAVVAQLKKVIASLESRGHTIKNVALPNISYSLAAYYILMPAEASTNLARYDGIRYGKRVDGDGLLGDYVKSRGEGFGKEVRRRIMLGTHVLSSGYYDAYYNQANKVRDLITDDFKKAFEDVDVLITPTSPIPAFKIGEKMNDPLSMYLADIFTVPVNLAGVPAISIPSGSVDLDGVDVPLAVQFIAPHCAENLLFDLGREVEALEKE